MFLKFPDLKVVLIESGVTWLPASLWRLDKTWRGVRAEDPWLEQQPTETVREHVRLTLQPFDAPPTEPQLRTLLEQLGSDRMLLFSSDYPHWHFDGDDALPPGLPAELIAEDLCRKPAGNLSSPEGDPRDEHDRPGSQARPIATTAQSHLGFIDCDVHPYVKGPNDFDPFLSKRWLRAQADHRRPHPPGPRRRHRCIPACPPAPACGWTAGRRTAATPAPTCR